MNKKKLMLARKKIDHLDNKMFNLIIKRTKIINHMILIKNLRKEIVDHKRINQILKKIKMKSIKNKIDPKITSQIWKSMIWSYVKYQRKNFKKR